MHGDVDFELFLNYFCINSHVNSFKGRRKDPLFWTYSQQVGNDAEMPPYFRMLHF